MEINRRGENCRRPPAQTDASNCWDRSSKMAIFMLLYYCSYADNVERAHCNSISIIMSYDRRPKSHRNN